VGDVKDPTLILYFITNNFMAKQKIFTAPEYIYFVFAADQNPQYGFSSYTDRVGSLGKGEGVPVYISYQVDGKNKQIPYFFGWGKTRDRVLRVEASRVDINKTSVADFLRSHPECKDSPNGTYYNDPATGERKQSGVFFKEMNEEQDAAKALEAKNYRREAENIVANLPLEEVYEINAVLGIFKVGEVMSRHALSEMAGNKPQVFMEAYQNPQRRAISIVRKGLDKKVLSYQGAAVIWNKTQIGHDEVDAAAFLSRVDNKKLLEALESAIKKIS
jgi:hypothetical protein